VIETVSVESISADLGAASMVRFLLLGGSVKLGSAVQSVLRKPLGFEAEVRSYPAWASSIATQEQLVEDFRGVEGEAFLLPVDLEFGVFEKDALGQAAAELRRAAESLAVHYDAPASNHPLVVEALADAVWRSFEGQPPVPERLGVLLVASGQSDVTVRSDAYALMRHLWERLGASRGEVAFLRHKQPFLPDILDRLANEPLEWVVIPAMTERTERFDHLKTILDDHCRDRPESSFVLVEPPDGHEALAHCVAQRALTLWRSKRQSETARERSPRNKERLQPRRIGTIETGVAADVRNADELRALLPEKVLDAETVFAKVTWHGYATGTYTDPVALDALLTAIPGKVVLLEGHTSSRNTAGRVDWDWETDARQHRAWIRTEENDYLERTGLAEVIRCHHATYLNVTEEYWDGRCSEVATANSESEFSELARFVPQVIIENSGAPLISFARFKGPTRLSLANLFGLIPEPLRARWHGPNITYLARVCCELSKVYGSVLDLYGVVESINAAVRWDRRGLYRSRWGNYDLISSPGLATMSRGVVAADLQAARLQGLDPRRSAYYDVVDSELGIRQSALDLELPDEWVRRFA
jgi:hypothetical protein